MSAFRPRPAVPCPATPAAPACAAAMCIRQLAGAKMCLCSACAGSWKFVVECASLGRSRVCSRSRVGVCRAGAAGRAHSRWKRSARSRVVELPARGREREGTRHGALFTESFYEHICNILSAPVLSFVCLPVLSLRLQLSSPCLCARVCTQCTAGAAAPSEFGWDTILVHSLSC